MAKVWKPHATVAAVIEREGQFLLVEEGSPQGPVYNQPAGHLEAKESLIEAVIRETLEETAYHFIPTGVLGIYQWTPPNTPEATYLRVAFIGQVTWPRTARPLDAEIIRAEWFTLSAIHALQSQHRSPLVMTCINDYLAGHFFPLSLVNNLDGGSND